MNLLVFSYMFTLRPFILATSSSILGTMGSPGHHALGGGHSLGEDRASSCTPKRCTKRFRAIVTCHGGAPCARTGCVAAATGISFAATAERNAPAPGGGKKTVSCSRQMTFHIVFFTGVKTVFVKPQRPQTKPFQDTVFGCCDPLLTVLSWAKQFCYRKCQINQKNKFDSASLKCTSQSRKSISRSRSGS